LLNTENHTEALSGEQLKLKCVSKLIAAYD